MATVSLRMFFILRDSQQEKKHSLFQQPVLSWNIGFDKAAGVRNNFLCEGLHFIGVFPSLLPGKNGKIHFTLFSNHTIMWAWWWTFHSGFGKVYWVFTCKLVAGNNLTEHIDTKIRCPDNYQPCLFKTLNGLSRLVSFVLHY